MLMDRPTLDRFMAKYVTDHENCWKWTAARRSGYGVMKVNGRMHFAHRLSYQHFVGPIQPTLEIDHLCRFKLCVNPTHLEPVPHLVNVRRGNGGQKNRTKTHCKHGHEFTPENTRLRTSRGFRERECRACQREHEARRPRNSLKKLAAQRSD